MTIDEELEFWRKRTEEMRARQKANRPESERSVSASRPHLAILLSASHSPPLCHDQAAFGHYRTKALVLAYFKALAAGDTTTDVAV